MIDADDNVIGVISDSETDLPARESEAAPTAAQGRPFRYIRLGPPARGQHAKIRARTAGRLMSKPPVCTHAEDTIAEVARTMAHHKANASRGARSTTKSTAAGSRSSGTRSLRERPGDL
ncbi:CBS domain-containing protein [Streptomyces sp. NPDC006691]|uniref:CBS domain-containing protein n=1 Tax=Streptomyces sp. NPDC006691 TaxID=3364757 RepID=UPI00367C8D5C